jgi:hypothetical protein
VKPSRRVQVASFAKQPSGLSWFFQPLQSCERVAKVVAFALWIGHAAAGTFARAAKRVEA